jgi:hypothetical protein
LKAEKWAKPLPIQVTPKLNPFVFARFSPEGILVSVSVLCRQRSQTIVWRSSKSVGSALGGLGWF